jgi:predicted DCC family thiol-disulfide oxidoreductase YuxK
MDVKLASEKDVIFYDGSCGLCHGFVRWVLARDRSNEFLFAPLKGEAFNQLLTQDQRHGLPDSIVLRTRKNAVLTEIAAVTYVLDQLGGFWSDLGKILELMPRSIANVSYRFVAKIRYRIFGRKTEACPLVPSHLRSRFLI